MNIRLADNETTIGRLEAWYNGRWEAGVCYDGGDYDVVWNDQAAAVACRQLGFDDGKALYYENILTATYTSYIKDVRCGDGKFSIIIITTL